MSENIKILILKICEIALEKNRRTKNTIFVDFSGHVNCLRVEIYKTGWKVRQTKKLQNGVIYW